MRSCAGQRLHRGDAQTLSCAESIVQKNIIKQLQLVEYWL